MIAVSRHQDVHSVGIAIGHGVFSRPMDSHSRLQACLVQNACALVHISMHENLVYSFLEKEILIFIN